MRDIKFKKLSEKAKLPSVATDGSAAMDLHMCSGASIYGMPGIMTRVCLGLSVEIPEGFVGLLMVRSSTGTKRRISLANGTGVIDSDYRGELMAFLVLDHGHLMQWDEGDSLLQLAIVPVESVNPIWADELSDTERGDGGFGSTTGKRND